jgi:hypothetical protein
MTYELTPVIHNIMYFSVYSRKMHATLIMQAAHIWSAKVIILSLSSA